MNTFQKWVDYKELDETLHHELLLLSDAEKTDAFYTDLSFGTGGMRGIMGPGTNRMNIYTLRRANYGYGKFLMKRNPSRKNLSVVIAYDSRRNSREFAQESAAVLAALGIRSILFPQVTPTPVLSYAIRYLKTDGGIVITASHNPPKYNGYKIYDETGCQLVPELADQVIAEIAAAPDLFAVPAINFADCLQNGMVSYTKEDVYDSYLEKVKGIQVHPELEKTTMKIVFTPLHGTSGQLGMRLLDELGYPYVAVREQIDPDPDFPTVSYPNPEDPKAFTLALEYAKASQADICIATDPDADRVGLAVFHNGRYQLLTGNQTGAILLYYLVHNRKTAGPGVVFNTIVTSPLGAKIASSHGLEVKSTLTGFKYIGEQAKLLEGTGKKFYFGYEESYGYVIGDFVRDKDSLQALLLCSEACCYYKRMGKTLVDILAEIYQEYGYHHDELVNVTLEGKEGAEKIQRILDYFRKAPMETLGKEQIVVKEDYLLSERTENGIRTTLNLPKSDVLKYFLADGSWFVLRPSGTEPKMKYYLSIIGNTEKAAEARASELKQLIAMIIEKAGKL